MGWIEDGVAKNFVLVCEDGVWRLVLANSSYPDALLVDGSRDSTGSQAFTAGLTATTVAPSNSDLIIQCGTDETVNFWTKGLIVNVNVARLEDGFFKITRMYELTADGGIQLDDVLVHDDDVYCDDVLERRSGAGVTVDGVLLKDGVLEDSAYPNALLVGGSRPMTGDFLLGDNDIYFGVVGAAGTVRINSGYNELQVTDEAGTTYRNIRVGAIFGEQFHNRAAAMSFMTDHSSGSYQRFYSYDTEDRLVMESIGGYIDIPRAGDVVLLAGKSIDALANSGYIKPHRVSQSAVPTPATGEMLVFYDTDDTTTHLVYEDSVGGTRSVELGGHARHSGLSGVVRFVDGESKSHRVDVVDGLVQSWSIA